jgi:uncharacterized membrane protein
MHQAVQTLAQYAGYFAEGVAALIILIGAVQALWIYFRRALLATSSFTEMTQSRIKLGHSLSLGLEFLIGADILKTAVAPTWNDIGQLAAVIAIRTVLNFFLMRELAMGEKPVESS